MELIQQRPVLKNVSISSLLKNKNRRKRRQNIWKFMCDIQMTLHLLQENKEQINSQKYSGMHACLSNLLKLRKEDIDRFLSNKI